MPLYRNGSFVDDDWIFPADDAPLPADGKTAVSRARFLADRSALLARGAPIGLALVAGDDLDDVVADLPSFALVAIRIIAYTDGRPYSLARLLRDRHGYTGELRATGDVLRDQIVLMQRAGFGSFAVTHAGTIAALREHRIVAVHHHYQPASAEAVEARDARAPWRRISSPLV